MTIAREHSACVRVSVSVLISVGRIWPWRCPRPEQVFGSACGERLTAVYVQDVYSKLTLLRPGWSPYGNEMDTRARRKHTSPPDAPSTLPVCPPGVHVPGVHATHSHGLTGVSFCPSIWSALRPRPVASPLAAMSGGGCHARAHLPRRRRLPPPASPAQQW